MLLAVLGALVSMGVRPGSEAGAGTCPRSFGDTQLAAVLLWDDAGGSMAPAPEVRRLKPEDLEALADPEDTESCRRLLAALPDTVQPGTLSTRRVGLYRAGHLFIVAMVAHHAPAEPDGITRGDPGLERPGETRIYGRDYRLLATYQN